MLATSLINVNVALKADTDEVGRIVALYPAHEGLVAAVETMAGEIVEIKLTDLVILEDDDDDDNDDDDEEDDDEEDDE